MPAGVSPEVSVLQAEENAEKMKKINNSERKNGSDPFSENTFFVSV